MNFAQIDNHNADVLTKALQAKGGVSSVRSLRVYCSDDQILCDALERMDNVRKRKPMLWPTSVVALVGKQD